jgi:hypothetical protein
MRGNTPSSDFVLSCDNETAKYENGVLTFTGDGMISVLPQSMEGGTLYIEDSEGNTYTYVIDVVEEHTCTAGEREVIIAPTSEYDGFAVKCCPICDDIMEIRDMLHHRRHLLRLFRRVKILPHAVFEHTRFADVDYNPVLVEHNVYARRFGQ